MEIKNLNLIPEGDKPIIHASQFDENRSVRFDLKDGTYDFTLTSNLVVTCNIKKVDGNIVTFEVENTESTYVLITLPLQATACAGPNIGEIVISYVTDEDTITIGTINFILEVERSPMLGGIDSASDIHDLEDQIEVIVTQVIATDYYTKTEVDNLLNDKADISDLPDMDNYYDKSSVDTLLNGKANVSDLNNYYNKSQVDNLLDDKADISDLPDMSDYYDKSEVNTLLANKADISDLPDMSNYYTKTQVDQKFLDIMPVNTASGSIANFTTSLALPLVALKAYIQAQGGGGTPSAPVAVTGFDSVVITQTDENMQTVNTFTIQLGQTCYGGYIDKNTGKFVVTHLAIPFNSQDLTWSYQSANTRFYTASLVNVIKKPSTSTSMPKGFNCECYNPHTFSGMADLDIAIATSGNIFVKDANYTDVNAWLNAIGNQKIVYPLDVPIETDITIPDITALVGENNIFADSGDIDVSFKQDIQNYVDSKISDANANRSLALMRATVEESNDEGSER